MDYSAYKHERFPKLLHRYSKEKFSSVHPMKTCRGNRGITTHWSTRWRSVANFTFRPLNPQYRIPATDWLGSCLGSKAIQDVLEERNTSCSYRDSSPGPSSPWRSRYTELSRLPHNNNSMVNEINGSTFPSSAPEFQNVKRVWCTGGMTSVHHESDMNWRRNGTQIAQMICWRLSAWTTAWPPKIRPNYVYINKRFPPHSKQTPPLQTPIIFWLGK
jgi:hypothetical protein